MSRLALLIFLTLFLFSSATVVDPPEHPVTLDGIDILFEAEPHMFPFTWYGKRINAAAESLPRELRTKAMDILNHAIAKYPEEVLFVNLRKVYVLKSLTFFGIPYGGTNAKDIIYLTFDNSNPGRTSEYVEGVFHHEFSSVLLRKFHKQFNEYGWILVNPPGFEYGRGGVEAIRNGEASMEYDFNLLSSGFLNKYAQSAFEEDINVFAQNLFSGGAQFWFIVDTFEKIHRKTALLIAFYQQINPSFTEAYFRSLACSR